MARDMFFITASVTWLAVLIGAALFVIFRFQIPRWPQIHANESPTGPPVQAGGFSTLQYRSIDQPQNSASLHPIKGVHNLDLVEHG